ncbi:uncharacterized protein LOC9654432 [Selaginella moellendorffii]|uniref:uncharacterized protein LOC9654432 n=1 Tax=Selaginella moellendorffii TaxID=88036 RepID=UPI000D1C68B1|nr:uncharacterized protein LOC9654432 [Selaginella moellendorffii]XP_024525059.1 uncharacterized protein LOC9654432 [Selaginella moellendorffii]|eukprot:XP_024525058.1 uncharacterized protein LOC9654432 [Selaginella moellendorffii]
MAERCLLGVLKELLRSRNATGAVKSAEIIGLLALQSESLNRDVASCVELLSSLVPLIASDDSSVSGAAIDAVADLGITAAARRALQECGVMDYFLSLFISLADSLSSAWNCDIEEHFGDALRVADSLLQEHYEVTIQRVPREIACTSYSKLRRVWKDILEGDGGSTSTRHLLAKLLALLGLELELPVSKNLGRHTFLENSQEFFEKGWERSPAVITNGTGRVFEALRKDFPAQDSSELLRTLVGASISCPPASSDELDPCQLFKEIHDDLGRPLIYQQDIRLVKCTTGDCVEQHYFSRNGEGQVVRVEDCIKAFELGYTVAVRGIEFRSKVVAELAQSLGFQLGQASIGANLYLTPSNAQGLGRHYDDHCVFVVQLAGKKRWSINPAATVVLPRLYAPRLVPEAEVQSRELADTLLTEGSVLYIPRGFAHRASTSEDGNTSKSPGRGKRKQCTLETTTGNCPTTTSKFSLHLTFGVEVELPFEWQGFIHIALHLWFLRENPPQSRDSRLCKTLLHFTVWSMADNAVKELRKACSVAMPATYNKSHATFKELIKKIASHAEESERAINGEECAAGLSWLGHLPGTQSLETDFKLAINSTIKEHRFPEMYVTARANFVERALYDDAVFSEARESFAVLLERYRTSRRKLINAMLALHDISKD